MACGGSVSLDGGCARVGFLVTIGNLARAPFVGGGWSYYYDDADERSDLLMSGKADICLYMIFIDVKMCNKL